MHTQRKGHMKIQQEGSHLQTEETSLRSHQTYWHLDLGFLASRTVRNKSLWFKLPNLCYLSGQPQYPLTKLFLLLVYVSTWSFLQLRKVSDFCFFSVLSFWSPYYSELDPRICLPRLLSFWPVYLSLFPLLLFWNSGSIVHMPPL